MGPAGGLRAYGVTDAGSRRACRAANSYPNPAYTTAQPDVGAAPHGYGNGDRNGNSDAKQDAHRHPHGDAHGDGYPNCHAWTYRQRIGFLQWSYCRV